VPFPPRVFARIPRTHSCPDLKIESHDFPEPALVILNLKCILTDNSHSEVTKQFFAHVIWQVYGYIGLLCKRLKWKNKINVIRAAPVVVVYWCNSSITGRKKATEGEYRECGRSCEFNNKQPRQYRYCKTRGDIISPVRTQLLTSQQK